MQILNNTRVAWSSCKTDIGGGESEKHNAVANLHRFPALRRLRQTGRKDDVLHPSTRSSVSSVYTTAGSIPLAMVLLLTQAHGSSCSSRCPRTARYKSTVRGESSAVAAAASSSSSLTQRTLGRNGTAMTGEGSYARLCERLRPRGCRWSTSSSCQDRAAVRRGAAGKESAVVKEGAAVRKGAAHKGLAIFVFVLGGIRCSRGAVH